MTRLLTIGSEIHFGTDGNCTGVLATGWSQDADQKQFTWMDGNVASLEFLMAQPPEDVLLSLKVMPYVGGSLVQQLIVFLNGLFVGLVVPSANEFREYSVLASTRYFSDSKDAPNSITFAAPNAVSPLATGLGQDRRVLSFAFMHVKFLDPKRISR
jgi:hypothetical protein